MKAGGKYSSHETPLDALKGMQCMFEKILMSLRPLSSSLEALRDYFTETIANESLIQGDLSMSNCYDLCILRRLSHAYELIVSGYHEDTPHDIRVRNLEDHGIHFCTSIQAVHRRAKKLLGLSAIEPGEPYRCDKFDKSHFEKFFAAKAQERERRKAWEIYNRH